MQSPNRSFASEITCPKCNGMYDDTSSVANHNAAPQARFPVQLVPCGHTICRPCVRAHFATICQHHNSATATEPPQPACPLCSSRIDITQFDEAALALVRSAQTQMMASRNQQHQRRGGSPAYSSDQQQQQQQVSYSISPAAEISAAASSGRGGAPAMPLSADTVDAISLGASLGPLDPQLRQQIRERCTRQEDAARAEHVARSVSTLSRAISFSKSEFDAASREREAATESVSARNTVTATLQGELKGIDDKIHALTLDRQVVLHQLQAALNEQSSAVKYRTECDMRVLEIQRRIQAEAGELENRMKLVQQLAPGIQM